MTDYMLFFYDLDSGRMGQGKYSSWINQIK